MEMVSSNGEEAAAAAVRINPLLLASARVGSWEALDLLLGQDPPMMVPTDEFLGLLARRRIAVPPTPDIELGVVHQPASLAARALLHGVIPDGDTALHAVASSGDDEHFLKYATKVCGKDTGLLFAKNHNGDTPLHRAARARNSKMVSRLIDQAGREGDNWKLKLLRTENNRHQTALHEAVRVEEGRILGPRDRKALFQVDHVSEEHIRKFVDQQEGMDIVKQLMDDDSQLASYPADGISPFYLAIFLQKSTIAVTLYGKSGGNLSYSGADGQNALYIALLRDRDTVMIELLLDWKKSLTTEVDKDGSTPLHFALSMSSWLRVETLRRPPWCRFVPFRPTQVVCKANPAALYQADKNGFFPIHVAASIGASKVIRFFLHEHPDNAGLREAKGKTFLHVAIEKRRLDIVSYVCGNPSLDWILNMQDNDGNTALHLAIQAQNFRIFRRLFRNREVNLILTNNQGETPMDVSKSKLPHGRSWYRGNSEIQINNALALVGAEHGALRRDKDYEKYSLRPKPEDLQKESERLKDTTQKYIVASVLIANMAFGAAFAIPGGYRGDDHPNGGTPTLAGGYIFDAFIVATALSFVCSLLATTGFMVAGFPTVNLNARRYHVTRSEKFFRSSVTSMSITFALGVYMVLAPVARNTAVAISVITPAILVGRDILFLDRLTIAHQLLIRKGLFPGTLQLLSSIMVNFLVTLWPFLVTFGWAAFARIKLSHMPLLVKLYSLVQVQGPNGLFIQVMICFSVVTFVCVVLARISCIASFYF